MFAGRVYRTREQTNLYRHPVGEGFLFRLCLHLPFTTVTLTVQLAFIINPLRACAVRVTVVVPFVCVFVRGYICVK